MKLTILLCFISICSFAQNDSIVFTLGTGNFVTIYKDGHAKRLPSPIGNSGKVLQSNGNGWALSTPSGGVGGYALQVQALTSSPTDAQTIYFGGLPKSPTTTSNISKIYIRQSGTIKRAEIYSYSGTAGTGEAWVMYIRKNNTTDTQIASVSLATSERVFSNTNLNISVVAGDYFEIKVVNPTFATNPLTTIFGGYIYIE